MKDEQDPNAGMTPPEVSAEAEAYDQGVKDGRAERDAEWVKAWRGERVPEPNEFVPELTPHGLGLYMEALAVGIPQGIERAMAQGKTERDAELQQVREELRLQREKGTRVADALDGLVAARDSFERTGAQAMAAGQGREGRDEMKDLRDRYHNDNTFHATVDYLRHIMREHHMTPVELKDAVLLATMIELERSPTPPRWLAAITEAK